MSGWQIQEKVVKKIISFVIALVITFVAPATLAGVPEALLEAQPTARLVNEAREVTKAQEERGMCRVLRVDGAGRTVLYFLCSSQRSEARTTTASRK